MEDTNITMYDANKKLLQDAKPLSAYKFNDKIEKMKLFFTKHVDKHYMMLCRELYDYSLFSFSGKDPWNLTNAAAALRECIQNRGECLDIIINDDACEIWMKINNSPYVYYIFPYDGGIIEV